jgi:hypothetical protein
MTDDREAYGQIVNDVRRAFAAEQVEVDDEGRRRQFFIAEWADRAPSQRELDMRIGEAVAAAVMESLSAALPEGARRPVTPELLTAFGALYQTWWNKVGTLESDDPGHSLISCEDVNAMDEAAQAVEAMLYPPAGDEATP